MKYYPKNHSAEYLLKTMGFESANRGYVLKRRKQSGKPVQYHALPRLDCIEFHADFLTEDKKHVSQKKKDRDEHFIKIISAIDDNCPLMAITALITKKMRRNYPTLIR